ncbi:hypothetical protein TNCV_534851 [Trichonephila clavipes]|nr:hypothetical protein TNCV_534851 [Trichonephila clavipes]
MLPGQCHLKENELVGPLTPMSGHKSWSSSKHLFSEELVFVVIVVEDLICIMSANLEYFGIPLPTANLQAVTPKWLGGPLVDRDRCNAHPEAIFKVTGIRKRGRPRLRWTDSLESDFKITNEKTCGRSSRSSVSLNESKRMMNWLASVGTNFNNIQTLHQVGQISGPFDNAHQDPGHHAPSLEAPLRPAE